MTKLRWISTRERLAGINAKKCEWSTIKNETFLVFREIAIKELLPVQCKIEIIESSAFEPLVSLEVLDLSFNPYLGLSVAFQSLAGLRLNMLAINMRMVNERFTRYKLEDSDFMYISKICVRSVDLSQNNIYYEQKRVFIPVKFRLDCLENLNMSYHTFNFWPSKMLEELRHSTSLTCLDFSHVGSGFQKLSDGLQTSVQFTPCFVLPPNLTWFSISCCKVWIDWWYDLCFGSPTKLRYLGFANLGLMELDKIVSPFVSMTNLQVIDLSSNMLTDLSLELFRETQNLMDVNLADNKLDRLPLALSHLNGLRKLNMSLNLIVYFQSDEIKLVENLISREDKEPRLQIMLSNNPLQCNCETLVFIGWLFRRAEIFDNVDKYKCSLSNGTRLFLKDFRLHLTDFEVKCISNTYLIISVVGILTVLVVVLLLVVIHRYRLNLRYWLCTKLMPPENMFVDQEYLYDAFVAYTSDEYEWVGQQLRPKLELVEDPVRLCIHDRDFIPGKPIHENIVQKMKESRKILLIISPGFLDSTYGPLEIEYAGMKCLEEGRDDVIICVLMEDIPVRQMPRALRNLWHKITFLKWSANLEAQAIFWRNLKGAVSQA
ncbi:toll-like receptor 13 [Liolophura sinensis]|uniref:toll-like receptor 13 n=1 Tax=Liolophura sinensis TaxID=3198878 RepID=UPI0031598B67